MDEDLDTLYSESLHSDDEWRDLFERCLEKDVPEVKLTWLDRLSIRFYMWIGKLLGFE